MYTLDDYKQLLEKKESLQRQRKEIEMEVVDTENELWKLRNLDNEYMRDAYKNQWLVKRSSPGFNGVCYEYEYHFAYVTNYKSEGDGRSVSVDYISIHYTTDKETTHIRKIYNDPIDALVDYRDADGYDMEELERRMSQRFHDLFKHLPGLCIYASLMEKEK